MSGRVTGGTKQPVVKAKTSTPKGAAPASKPPEAPALNERALRRTGKASGFTRSFTAFPGSGVQPQVASEAPVVRAGSAQAMQQLRNAGGQLPTDKPSIEKAEGRVAFNASHTQEWSMAQLKKDPKGFLKNVVQLDGALGSTADRTACGPTSLLMGMIAGNPESIEQLASKLVDKIGNLTPAGEAFSSRLPNAEAREELQDALVHLREGKAFTAANVTTLANSMQGVERLAGADPNDLRETAIAIGRLGVKVPAMELQLFGNANGSMGHWRVVSQGTQFNPWPNEKGQSTQLPAKEGLAAGKSDGAGWVLRDTVRVVPE